VENPTAGVTSEKSPDQIEKDMERTRESITEKVSLLENQVIGVASSVTETVQAVTDAVTAAPTAVSDTVKQTIESVKDSVRETIGSFSVSGCVRDNPWSAIGTTTVAGFLAGYFFGGRSGGGLFSRPIMAQGHDAPASNGRVGSAHTAYDTESTSSHGRAAGGGLFSGLFAMVGQEIHQLAEQALSTAVASLKQSISTQVPQMVDTAVQGVTERVACAVGGHHDTTRVGGPGYSATAPAAGG